MWPFAALQTPLDRLEGSGFADVLTKVASPNDATSPISGGRAAFVHVELLERVPGDNDGDRERGGLVSLGAVIFGDVVTLEVEGQPFAVDLVARRAELRFANIRPGGVSVRRVIPELVPLLSRAKRGGVICHREHLVVRGDRLRLRAFVERKASVYPSGVSRLVVRDDLAPVWLDEVLDGLAS